MENLKKNKGRKGVMRVIVTPLIIVLAIGAYVFVSGKLGTCPACVSIVDAVLGPQAVAAETAAESSAWSFPDLEGGSLESTELAGDVAVVTFWATWCPPCRKEISALNTIHERYAEKGVQVIGVSVDDDKDDALRAKIKKLGIKYPVVRGNENIPALFGEIKSIPTVVIFTRDQEIAFRHVGYMSEEKLEQEIKKLL